MQENTNKRLTLKAIGDMVGISKSAVSGVLNNNPNVRVNEKKKEQIFQIMEKHNYMPNSWARALSSNRNYQIGFMVSARVTLGLANNYFSAILAQVQATCQQYGYLCVTSVYDLNNIEHFVMPRKLKQRSIDGLVIAGTVDKEVLKQIHKLGIPCYLLTQVFDYSAESLDNVLCMAHDVEAEMKMELNYLHSLGHTRIAVEVYGAFDINWVNKAAGEVSRQIDITPIPQVVADNFMYGCQLGRRWLTLEEGGRYTALVANDQVCAGFLFTLQQSNLMAPRDISLVAGCDSTLCKWLYPGLTAIDNHVIDNARNGTSLLIELVEDRISFQMAKRRSQDFFCPSELIIRGSSDLAPEAPRQIIK